jgi:hypothetical protein
MSYANDPAYLNLVEASRAYRAQPNIMAANNASAERNREFSKNFFKRTGRYPSTDELIEMSVEAEMDKLRVISPELADELEAARAEWASYVNNPSSASPTHNYYTSDAYNTNIAKWKAGVANGTINAAPRNFRGARKAQNEATLKKARNNLAAGRVRNQLIVERALAGQGSGVYVPPSTHNVKHYWNQFMSPENRERVQKERAISTAAAAALRGKFGPAHTRKNRKNRR